MKFKDEYKSIKLKNSIMKESAEDLQELFGFSKGESEVMAEIIKQMNVNDWWGKKGEKNYDIKLPTGLQKVFMKYRDNILDNLNKRFAKSSGNSISFSDETTNAFVLKINGGLSHA
jgi:hypothetical protein